MAPGEAVAKAKASYSNRMLALRYERAEEPVALGAEHVFEVGRESQLVLIGRPKLQDRLVRVERPAYLCSPLPPRLLHDCALSACGLTLTRSAPNESR
jgi:hypothetical protein